MIYTARARCRGGNGPGCNDQESDHESAGGFTIF
ncbi:hypothetical protein N185_05890 [Sinorhizobium sp. GW3]|nr:hypothetical protein N185_05890 [Sinorhizobium sp. GW3]